MTRPPLAFVGICDTCGAPTEPCPAEGDGESWKSAEQWLYLALHSHRQKCQGPNRKATPLPIIATVTPVDPDYERLAAALTAEPLATEWRHDAESWHEDGISYVVAYVPDPGKWPNAFIPAAWAGYRVESMDGPNGNRTVLRCCNNYVRRDCRDGPLDLYATVYRVRHREVLVPSGLPGWTVLYPQPIPLHEADGWTRATGPDSFGTSVGDGGDVHHWQVLTWTPRP